MEQRILRNSIMTPDGTILVSYHRHDYKNYTDKNGETYITDGGNDYLRRSINKKPYTDLTVYDDGKHETRRVAMSWGKNYDKYGNLLPETTWSLIYELDTDHIQAIINEGFAKEFYFQVFKDELEWRKQHPEL